MTPLHPLLSFRNILHFDFQILRKLLGIYIFLIASTIDDNSHTQTRQNTKDNIDIRLVTFLKISFSGRAAGVGIVSL